MYGLGKCEYIALYHKDASYTLNGDGNIITWKWRVPQTLNRRKSPSWFIKMNNLYLDSKTAGQGKDKPHFIRCKVVSENYHTFEKNGSNIGFPILTMLSIDVEDGHFTTWTNNPSIMVSSSIQYLEIDIVDGNGVVIPVGNAGELTGVSLNMILEVEIPEHNEVRDNTVMSYAQSTVGNPPFNRL